MSTYHNLLMHIRGNIAADPDIKVLNEGQGDDEFKIASFPVACNLERWDSDAGEVIERTEYFDITIFGSTANYIEQVAGKGDTISLQVERRTDTYTDSDGNDRKSYEYVHVGGAGDLQILSDGGGGGSSSGGGTKPAQELDNEAASNGTSNGSSSGGSSGDDLPF